jgi:glutamine amidotransferase
MQLLADSSKEGGHFEGLGLIPGRVVKIEPYPGLLVPHVGWNDVNIASKAPLFSNVSPDACFFFDHSYRFVCDQSYVVATCAYGDGVVAAVQSGNIFGAQFHPEKSQNNGLKLFRGFMRYVESGIHSRQDIPC